MQSAAVLGAEQNLRDQTVLKRIGRTPFTRHQRVVTQMPPSIIGQVLRTAIHLPLSAHLERLMVHEKNATGALTFAVTQGRYIDALGSAVHGVRSRITGPVGDFAGL